MTIKLKASKLEISALEKVVASKISKKVIVGVIDADGRGSRKQHNTRTGKSITFGKLTSILHEGVDGKLPARPFLDIVVQNFQPQILDTLLRNVLRPGRPNWRKVGEDLVDLVLIAITMVEGNSPTTVAKKGFNQPLIETGALIQAIKYVIKDK